LPELLLERLLLALDGLVAGKEADEAACSEYLRLTSLSPYRQLLAALFIEALAGELQLRLILT
jgi:hypothetical protein